MSTTPPVTRGAQLGTKDLSVIHAIGQSLSIGPIFSAGVITGLIASVAGFSTPLSVLLGSIGALGLGYVIAIYARRYAGAGAIYEYLARGANPVFGVFSAGLYFVGSLFLGGGGIYIAIGYFTQGFFSAHLNASIPWWLGGVIGLAIVFALNHFGVKLAVGAVLVLAALSSLPIIFLSLVIIAKGGFHGNTFDVFTAAHAPMDAVFHGILFAVTLFIGFEAAASIAEECRSPRTAIPVAVLATIAISAAFFILVTYAVSIGYGLAAINKGAWANSASPLDDMATKYVGSWLGAIIDISIILDMLSLSIAIMVTCARGFFALGRDGLLPGWMARTTDRGTPLAGNLIVVVWSLILLVWAALQVYDKSVALPAVFQTFLLTTAVGSYLVELIYLFLAVVALYILWTDGQRNPLPYIRAAHLLKPPPAPARRAGQRAVRRRCSARRHGPHRRG